MNLEEKLTNVVEDGSLLPFAVEEESHHLNVCRNRRQTEGNQTCLDCRCAKEEKARRT